MTTVLLFADLHTYGHFGFDLQITLWLWFTVLFANFAEAMAEGRGKAQADALRKAKSETTRTAAANGNRRGCPARNCAPAMSSAWSRAR
jgi:high-affinity K+ transport system ATPase subunit B